MGKLKISFFVFFSENMGGAVASRLLRSSPHRVVRVRALVEDIVLCSWARHSVQAVPLYPGFHVPANLTLGVTL